MAECLLHPRHGYYATRDPLGAAGDFTTAPEISQMFGECLGLCARAGLARPGRARRRVVLAELGPGRGTLMADVLRATRAGAGLPRRAVGPPRRGLARAAGRAGRARAGRHLARRRRRRCPRGRCSSSPTSSSTPCPIRQFVRRGDGWAERVVGLAGRAPRLGPARRPGRCRRLAHRLADTRRGRRGGALPRPARRSRARSGGGSRRTAGRRWSWTTAAGASRATRFQAVAAPRLRRPARGAGRGRPHRPCGLRGAGPGRCARPAPPPWSPRARSSSASGIGRAGRGRWPARPRRASGCAAHLAALRRLTLPDEMGTLFKAMGVRPRRRPAAARIRPHEPRHHHLAARSRRSATASSGARAAPRRGSSRGSTAARARPTRPRR